MSQAATRTSIRISPVSFARPRLASVLLALALITVLCLVFVWSRIHAINLEYSLSQIDRDIRSQQRQIEELRTEAAFLARDERIEQLARKNLGLRTPLPGQIIRVD